MTLPNRPVPDDDEKTPAPEPGRNPQVPKEPGPAPGPADPDKEEPEGAPGRLGDDDATDPDVGGAGGTGA
jgi:hypothetical protein